VVKRLTEEKKEEKPKLSEDEIKKLTEMNWRETDHWYPGSQELEKLSNTVEALEDDLKTVKGIKRFIDPGVLVNDRLVLYAKADEYRTDMGLRAFGEDEHQVNVGLSIEEAERMRSLLKGAIEAAKKGRDLRRLKKLLEQKKSSRRY